MPTSGNAQADPAVGKLANHTGELRETLAKPTQTGAEDPAYFGDFYKRKRASR